MVGNLLTLSCRLPVLRFTRSFMHNTSQQSPEVYHAIELRLCIQFM
jgi:hypothetical protein